MADAHAQATMLAQGMRGRLGRLRDVSADEPTRFSQAQQNYLPADTPYDSQAKLPPEVTIAVSVRARWELRMPSVPPGA